MKKNNATILDFSDFSEEFAQSVEEHFNSMDEYEGYFRLWVDSASEYQRKRSDGDHYDTNELIIQTALQEAGFVETDIILVDLEG